ncbi:hypothetical protein [Raineyella fluvialis]|nr:hypothetical protein [Raineyella fluvialis]
MAKSSTTSPPPAAIIRSSSTSALSWIRWAKTCSALGVKAFAIT